MDIDIGEIMKEAKIEKTRIYTVRANAKTLLEFRKACDRNGSNANRTLEKFMEKYIEEMEKTKA